MQLASQPMQRAVGAGRAARVRTVSVSAIKDGQALPEGKKLRVAVIGGGPSGACAAETLAAGGVEAFLLERKLDNCKVRARAGGRACRGRGARRARCARCGWCAPPNGLRPVARRSGRTLAVAAPDSAAQLAGSKSCARQAPAQLQPAAVSPPPRSEVPVCPHHALTSPSRTLSLLAPTSPAAAPSRCAWSRSSTCPSPSSTARSPR